MWDCNRLKSYFSVRERLIKASRKMINSSSWETLSGCKNYNLPMYRSIIIFRYEYGINYGNLIHDILIGCTYFSFTFVTVHINKFAALL